MKSKQKQKPSTPKLWDGNKCSYTGNWNPWWEREWWGIRNIYIFNGQEFLPQLIPDARPQVQEAQGTRHRINTEKSPSLAQFTRLTDRRIKCRRSTWQNSNSVHDQDFWQTKNWKELPGPHIKHLCLELSLMIIDWVLFTKDQEQGCCLSQLCSKTCPIASVIR